ncbi:MAG TPA: hypothetical protein PKM73_01380 [Verrucomicrobiota bacterium]|nr:hypothetical protein [Verrucomicrobiota bacterium]HNU50036.1 hypothetical protein [Verrucomicrobiota bacterium]
MKWSTRDILIASVAACAAAVSLYFTAAGRSPKIALGTYEALGAVTAEETARLLGPKGQVLVIARDTGADKNPSVEAQLEAFRQTLKKQGGLRLVTERFVATPMMMMATGGAVPLDHLVKALEKHATAGALVLFCGLPPLEDSVAAMLKQRKVKVVVVSSFHPEYGPLLEQGVIHLAIVPKPNDLPPDAQPPRTVREQFDQDYAIIKPQP